MLLAVLHRHAGIACFDQDVFLNAVGGVKITEPAAALASTFRRTVEAAPEVGAMSDAQIDEQKQQPERHDSVDHKQPTEES